MEFYHDHSQLGLSLPQRGLHYPANQAVKAPVILDYMRRAIADVRCQKTDPTFAELFCADAHYSFMAAKMGAGQCDAFDNDKDGHLREAFEVRRMLGAEQRVTLHNIDVHDIDPTFRASIVLNAGGLYHVLYPLEVLDLSYQMATHWLIVQTVVSLANESSDYFETPAPGWPHGCRFSAMYLEKAIRERGWHIAHQTQNVLTANARPDDRGSVYFLLSKQS